jgi:molybdate transport system substrate-binding protein
MGGCSSQPTSQLTIGAAASYTLTLDELGPAFAQTGGIEPTISIGSTGQLTQQIENGAPFDVFMAADALHVDRLIEDGLIVPESRTLIAYGRLVVIGAQDHALDLESIQDLTSTTIGRIAIANPEHAPYGQAALQALENSGLLSSLENRIIYAETVRQAAQMVESGNAEVGIVAASVLTDRVIEYFTVPQDLFDPIEHVAGILAASSSQATADEFLTFLTSPTAQTIFEAYGFEPIIPNSE